MKSIVITVVACIVFINVFFLAKSYFLRPHIEQGAEAANISGTLRNGSGFSLSDLRGKYVLLDYWGSWCKPCRESHPQLVKLYNDYHDKVFKDGSGFEIVSFGVEKNQEAWLNAIAQDNLDWEYHLVSTHLFDSPQVKAFDVKQIPTKFLINPEGIIIAVNPGFPDVKYLLDQRLSHASPR